MLNNLGFGEIATLALMALLFFGPERLPQLGARVGRWIATLTQSSKVFMDEWREEALVVYDAVKEVKGIRDEILAARAEITGTVTTARDDVTGALSGARADVQAQVRGATTFSPTPAGSTEKQPPARIEGGKSFAPAATPPTTTPDRAIERTNEILAGLREKRGETEPAARLSEPPSSTTFSDANPLNQSAQHLWHQTAPKARKSPRRETQRAAAPSSLDRDSQRPQPSFSDLNSLHETIATLEADVQALRDELARTRATLEAKTLSPGSGTAPHTEPETDTVPHSQPGQAGEPL